MNYLVTGGSGFLGERLIERLLKQGHEITTIARNEGKLFALKQKFPSINIFAGDIAEQNVIYQANLQYGGFDGLFHLAAWKFVSEAEKQVMECIRSNIMGTKNVLETSLMMANPPKFYLGISTDKAAQATGVYGCSKLIMERMFKMYEDMQVLPIKYRIVRYGNVLYSTGSVLCKWKDLIQQDKEIIVTDPSATRFFWTRDSAIDLIFDCLENAKDSSPYCPTMKSIRIYDLLLAMYDKYGNRSKMKIKEIGLQPGENLHEKILENGHYSNEVEQYTIDEIKEMI